MVCKRAFIRILGTSHARLTRVFTAWDTSVRRLISRKRKPRCLSAKHTTMAAWLDVYSQQIGEKMPHLDQVHLPHFLTKKAVYQIMKNSLMEEGLHSEDIISFQHFVKVWNTEFKKVVIPKMSRFSKCDLCIQYSDQRQKVCGDKEATRSLEDSYSRHLKHVLTERKKYYKHREKARNDPAKYLCVIIDGMDQAKTNVPQLPKMAKSAQNLWRLRTHVTGTLVHTRADGGKCPYIFIDLHQWPSTSNTTIAILLYVINQQEQLPQVLYLQLDNCFKENKNRYLLAFCALLVELKIFRKVKINFLPVGHTHEDIDQLFSKISQRLEKTGAETLSGLSRVITESYHPQPSVIIMKDLYNAKEWLKDSINDIHGHSEPLCFKFELDSDNKSQLFTARWSDGTWKNHRQLLKGHPMGSPELDEPSLEALDLKLLATDIEKWLQWLSTAAHAEWRDFFENLVPELTTVDSTHLWLLEELQVKATAQRSRRAENNSCVTYDYIFAFEQTAESHPRQNLITAVENTNSLEIGQLVAIFCEDWHADPAIGECLELGGEEIGIRWLEGSYSSAWTLCKVPDPQDKRRKVDWMQDVPRSSIILYNFKLTTKNHLRKHTVLELKKLYEQARMQTPM